MLILSECQLCSTFSSLVLPTLYRLVVAEHASSFSDIFVLPHIVNAPLGVKAEALVVPAEPASGIPCKL